MAVNLTSQLPSKHSGNSKSSVGRRLPRAAGPSPAQCPRPSRPSPAGGARGDRGKPAQHTSAEAVAKQRAHGRTAGLPGRWLAADPSACRYLDAKRSVPSSPAPQPAGQGRGPSGGPAPRQKRRRTPGRDLPSPAAAPLPARSGDGHRDGTCPAQRSPRPLRASLWSWRKKLLGLRAHGAGRRDAGNERAAPSAPSWRAAGGRTFLSRLPIARGLTRLAVAGAATILNTAPQPEPPPPAAATPCSRRRLRRWGSACPSTYNLCRERIG
ncbi:translation initiation factor IF-2-like [Rissa tridactyla]|uniref:translation initiation factor IF-2-like n=1 Tax=Rissa tridactyla TaxID=75485 RepID=UPI0023BB1A4A|nr:translation initiation factor IF-2-like [Rissa tridactyla]